MLQLGSPSAYLWFTFGLPVVHLRLTCGSRFKGYLCKTASRASTSMGLALLPSVDNKSFTPASPVGAFLLTPVVAWCFVFGGSNGEVEHKEDSGALCKESSLLFSKAKRILRREVGASRDLSDSDIDSNP